MGYIDELIMKPHFKSRHQIHTAAEVDEARAQKSILCHLRPAALFCRCFGVFPYSIDVLHPSQSPSASIGEQNKTTLILEYNRKGWRFFSFIIFLISSAYMIFEGVSFIICVGKGHTLIQLSAQSLWFSCPLLSYVVSIFILLKGDTLVQIFDEWGSIERDLERLFCPIMTRRQILRFQKVFLILAVLSNTFCAIHVIKQPKSPMYVFYYVTTFNEVYHWIYVIFQMLVITWMWAGFFVLEGTCCLFATVIVQCMDTLIGGLDIACSTFENVEDLSLDGSSVSGTEKNKKISTTDVFKDHSELAKMHKEGYILFVVKKMQTVASLQGKINDVIGPLLLLDVGLLVVLSCVLLFLPIRFAEFFDIDSTVVFAGNAISIFSRLTLFIVCLGAVFTKSQDMNVALAKALSSSHLSVECQNPVLAHLTVYSTNPMGFSAWGFFSITRGTLLAALSLISTYAVVFFQMKM